MLEKRRWGGKEAAARGRARARSGRRTASVAVRAGWFMPGGRVTRARRLRVGPRLVPSPFTLAGGPMSFSRRALLRLSGAAALGSSLGPPTELAGEDLPFPAPLAALKPMTAGIPTISLEEHRARLVGAQRLMAEAGLEAIAVGPGTSLTYFTGAEWGLSERFLGFVLTREGDPAWVTPAFEKQRALEQIRMGTDVRAWEEDESPYDLVASILRARRAVGVRPRIKNPTPFPSTTAISNTP